MIFQKKEELLMEENQTIVSAPERNAKTPSGSIPSSRFIKRPLTQTKENFT